MNTEQIQISSLQSSKHNVRKTGGQSVADLAASIKAVGLLQNLTVHKTGNGYAVIAGSRRLAALKELQKSGHLPKDHAVPCNVLADDVDVTEASLAENVVREAMHPADQFDAFSALADNLSATEIAARFGVTEALVKQRMKLAKVAPAILAEYRTGKATLEQIQALTLTDDHAAQIEAWGESDGWHRRPVNLRDNLTETEIPSSDGHVRFVGLDQYEQAGGYVRRDLFSDRAFIADKSLLDSLVKAKLEQSKDALLAEGWQFVDVRGEISWVERNEYQTIARPSKRPYTEAERTEYETLDKRLDEINEVLDDAEGEEYERLDAEGDRIRDRMEGLETAAEVYPATVMKKSGVLIYLSDGEVKLDKAVTRKAEAKQTETSTSGGNDWKPKKDPSELPQKSVERLWGEQTAIIRSAISSHHALAALAVNLSAGMHYKDQTPVTISKATGYMQPDMGEAAEAWGVTLESEWLAADDRWENSFQKAGDDVFGWLINQPVQVSIDLIAYCAAKSIVVRADGTEFAQKVGINPAEYWTLTEAWLAAQPKGYILAALKEVKTRTDGMDKLKTAELAAKAFPILEAAKWVPEPLRPYEAPKRDRKQAAANDRD